MCRSPRMSLELDQLGQLALARRLELAAVLAQLGRDPLHPEQLVDLLLGGARVRWSPSRRRRSPYSLTWRPRRTASVRSASLCLPEPVKCWSRLPNVSSGTIRRSTGRPEWVIALAPAAPEDCDLVDQRQLAERRRRAPPDRSRWPRCRGPCRSRPCAARCRPARRAIAAGCSRSAATSSSPIASAFESSMRALGRPSAPAASAASTFSSALAPKPVTSLQPLLLGGLAQIVERLDAELVVAACARASGPRPGMRVTSTRPGGNFAPSACRRPGSCRSRAARRSSRRSSCRRPASSATRPCARQLLDRHRRLADRLGRVAVGDHPVHDGAVELVQARQLVEGLCYLGVSHRRH